MPARNASSSVESEASASGGGAPRDSNKCRASDCPLSVPAGGFSGGRPDELLAPDVVAVVVVADDLPAVLLRRLLDEVRRAALGALLRDRTIPQHEVAVRIIRAAEEGLPAARFPLDDLAALVGVLRAGDAGRLVLDVLALGVIRARRELAV